MQTVGFVFRCNENRSDGMPVPIVTIDLEARPVATADLKKMAPIDYPDRFPRDFPVTEFRIYLNLFGSRLVSSDARRATGQNLDVIRNAVTVRILITDPIQSRDNAYLRIDRSQFLAQFCQPDPKRIMCKRDADYVEFRRIFNLQLREPVAG